MSSKSANAKNVLFIPSGSIGDALMMLALCVEIERYQKDTTFTIIARRNAGLIQDLAKAYPFLRIVRIERSIGGLLRLVWESVRLPYQAFMPAAFGKSWFLNTEYFFTLLKYRPGTHTFGLLKKQGDPDPYNMSIVYEQGRLHIDNMRALARAAGFTVEPQAAPITYTFDARLPANFPFAPKQYLVFHPFGSASWKSFPPKRSHELLQKLAVRYPHLSIVVTGGPENQKEAEEITNGVPRTCVYAGAPILEAIGIIENASFYLGVDTGTLHLASVAGQRVIALEHGAGPEWLPKYNPNAIMLSDTERCVCGGRKNDQCLETVEGRVYTRCILGITDEAIFEKIDTLV